MVEYSEPRRTSEEVAGGRVRETSPYFEGFLEGQVRAVTVVEGVSPGEVALAVVAAVVEVAEWVENVVAVEAAGVEACKRNMAAGLLQVL